MQAGAAAVHTAHVVVGRMVLVVVGRTRGGRCARMRVARLGRRCRVARTDVHVLVVGAVHAAAAAAGAPAMRGRRTAAAAAAAGDRTRRLCILRPA